ncbi:MAG: glycosyl hydrolase, partial [Flavobacteriales bacterium]|nr:glycosyl hydrolase [Flavobacteriales bacterium]
IKADPRAEVNLEQMQEQYDFVFDVNKTIDKAHKSIKKIRKINTQLGSFVKQYEEEEAVLELVAKAKELKKSFSDIEKALYQTQNRSNQDPLNFPIRLTNKLGHLNSLVTMDDFPPTAQDIAVKNELSAEINAELDAFDSLISKEIKNFNDSFNSLNLDYLIME